MRAPAAAAAAMKNSAAMARSTHWRRVNPTWCSTATVAVGHHLGFTRRQWVDLAIAALFFIAAAAAAGALIVTRIRAAKHITTDAMLAQESLAPDALVPIDR